MGEVIAHLAMSLDGFIADPDDGCDELFGFYDSGGSRLYDITNGRDGHPGEPSVESAVAGTRGPVRLPGPAVIEDHGVTHLRYRVRKES
jgi:hypothetical protein